MVHPVWFLISYSYSEKKYGGNHFGWGMFIRNYESLQFVLETGVSDIDDVFFNVCGTIIGFILYRIIYRFL